MGRQALYQNSANRKAIMEALRSGSSRSDAAKSIGASLQTFNGWIDNDQAFEFEVKQAEAQATKRESAPKKRQKADRWEEFKNTAGQRAPGTMGFVLHVDDLLVSAGFPPMSPWWKSTLSKFFASGKRTLLLRVGRGGGKSSTLCRVAVVEALFGEHTIHPGDIGVWPVISTDKGEARGRLDTIKKIIASIGIEYHENEKDSRPRIVAEDAQGRPIEFRVYPATVAGASGFSAIGATCDEEAKWRDDEDRDRGRNPAKEVLAALRPTFRGRAGTHCYRCSSAFAESGTHYEDVEAGTTKAHFVATIGAEFIDEVRASFYALAETETDLEARRTIYEYAENLEHDSPNVPTWLANPTISIEQTRDDEPDLAVWMREYASKSMGYVGVPYFNPSRLDESLRPSPEQKASARSIVQCFAALDTGSKSNSCTLAVCERTEWRQDDSSAKSVVTYRLVELREWRPTPNDPLDLDRVVLPEAAQIAVTHGCEEWTTDAYYPTSVQLRGAERGIRTIFVGGDIHEKYYEPVRRAVNRGEISLGGMDLSDELIRQLKLVRQAPTDGGKMKIIIPVEPIDGVKSHGDLGVAAVRALAAAGAGAVESELLPDAQIESVGSDRRDECY